MADETVTSLDAKAWLVARTGPLAGSQYLLREGTTQIGRSAESDIVVHGPNTATVSAQHFEIRRVDGVWRIVDTGSTNGTFLNGERVTDAELHPDSIIRLGSDGPEFGFVREAVMPSELDSTLVIPQGIQLPPRRPIETHEHDDLISEAVRRVRRARLHGVRDQTMHVMRDLLNHALRRNSRRFRITIWVLAIALALSLGGGYWKIAQMKSEKAVYDHRIEEIETRLAEAEYTPEQADRLISELDAYAGQAETLQNSLLYRMGGGPKEDFVTQQVRLLMAEFGAEVYSIPPEFIERIRVYIAKYQGPDRPHMSHALDEVKDQIAIMQQILREERLPPDFAYVPIVESALAPRLTSAAGAVGPWQFTAVTARAFGLRVDGAVDERTDILKSTHAAARFLRQLLLDFGTGSSVMLALAAYNLGPTKVKQAVLKSVEDPIKQRNFWYLYRIRALPAETREFVPKVFAAIVVGRNPERFGF